MSFIDLHEGILEEFAERSNFAISSWLKDIELQRGGLSIREPKGESARETNRQCAFNRRAAVKAKRSCASCGGAVGRPYAQMAECLECGAQNYIAEICK